MATIYSSDVTKYDGATLIIPIPAGANLNDVLVAIDAFIATIASPTTTLDTNHVTIAANITEGKIILVIGDTAQKGFQDIAALVNAHDVAFNNVVVVGDYSAQSILYAITSGVPTALTVPVDTLVGRLTGGNIKAVSKAELITLLALLEKDETNHFIKPDTAGYSYAVGADTKDDKILLAILEDAVFANNPFITWLHAILDSGDAGQVTTGMDATKLVQKFIALKEKNSHIIASEGTGSDIKDQQIILSDQTGIASTLRYWKIKKDGADSRTAKFIYYNGTTETVLFKINIAGLVTFKNGVGIYGILDEDNMASDSNTHSSTQQSIKAYADTKASQTELDATQTGAGLNSNGSYTPPGGNHYLASATSLNDADKILDAKIFEINTPGNYNSIHNYLFAREMDENAKLVNFDENKLMLNINERNI